MSVPRCAALLLAAFIFVPSKLSIAQEVTRSVRSASNVDHSDVAASELLSSQRMIIVSQEDLQAAMAAELVENYDASKTTNAARFFAGVVLDLGEQAQQRDPHGPPLFLGHDDWYRAFVDAGGIADGVIPLHVRLARDFRQDVMIDYDIDGTIKKVKNGERPRLALSVQIGWPESESLGRNYSYEDTLAKPILQITNHRVIRQRILDFGDVISFDEVTGITGRPTTGLLAFFFKVIGEGHIDWSRFYIADNGIQVTRGGAHKGPFSTTETIHVFPDGRGESGIPGKEEMWRSIESRIKDKPKIEYHDYTLPDFEENHP